MGKVINLPTEATTPQQDASNISILLYGKEKVGKTTLCSKIPDALHLPTEPGTSFVSVKEIPIEAWDDILSVCTLLFDQKNKGKFKTIVIDTIDIAVKMCQRYISAKKRVEDVSDLQWGKGSNMVNSELQRILTAIKRNGYGLYLVGHSKEQEIEGRTKKYTRIVPNISDGMRKVIEGFVDAIGYCDIIETRGAGKEAPTIKRVIKFGQSLMHASGDRSGRLPAIIPLQYEALRDALAAKESNPILEEEEEV